MLAQPLFVNSICLSPLSPDRDSIRPPPSDVCCERVPRGDVSAGPSSRQISPPTSSAHQRQHGQDGDQRLYLVLRLFVVEGHHGSVVLGDRPDLAQVVRDVLQLDIVSSLIALRARLLILHLNIQNSERPGIGCCWNSLYLLQSYLLNLEM